MDFFTLLTGALGALVTFTAFLVSSAQLSRPSKERRLEAFLRESSNGLKDDGIVSGVRRELVARAIARDAVPLSKCIPPVIWMVAVWTVIGVAMYEFQWENLVAVLVGVFFSFAPPMILALWRHERTRAMQVLRSGGQELTLYTGTLRGIAAILPHWGLPVLFGVTTSGIVAMWAGILGGAVPVNGYTILAVAVLAVAAAWVTDRYFNKTGNTELHEPTMQDESLHPSWQYPPHSFIHSDSEAPEEISPPNESSICLALTIQGRASFPDEFFRHS